MVDFKDFHSLTIDGHILTGYEIVRFCQKSHSKNIRAIGDFIQSWLHPSPLIQVQTSGSTGAPKLIEVEKNQMLASASMTAQFFHFQSGQNALLCLPMSYIAGKMMVVRALYSGLNLVCVEPQSSPLQQLKSDTEIDFAPLTPMQLQHTIQTPRVKTILLGGGPIHPELEKNTTLLQAAVFHGYGMTETLSHIALRRVNGSQASISYHTLPGITVATDQRECLTIQVPFLKNTIVTNDVVELVSDTAFIWKGRYDHVINSGGIKLFPEKIEKILAPILQERFFVTGIEDSLLGQKLCLVIEGESFDKEKLNQLKNKMPTLLTPYEIPKKILFISRFSVTESGKIQRVKSLGKS